MKRQTRRKLAVLALLLGLFFTLGAIVSVLSGNADPLALIVLLPVFLVMYRIYTRWLV